MAQKSGFFNSRIVAGNPDRKYNAADYSDNLAVVISNGVLRSSADDLKVTSSGLACTVGVGRGWIGGHYYRNDTPLELAAVTAPVAGDRWDRVILRLNTAIPVREIEVVYVQGTAANDPVKPEPVREGDVYDLVLADVFVAANATAVVVTDTRADADLCGWVYSTSGDGSFFTSLDNQFETWFEDKKDTLASVTLFKRYEDEITLESETDEVSFNIPQYDPDTCFAEVYVNGILDDHNTIGNGVVTFDADLIAGTVVTVRVYKSLDGEGIMSVADEITELQEQMQAVIGEAKFVFNCTGTGDNVSISQIAQAIIDGSYDSESVTDAADSFLTRLGGNAWLGGLPADAQITIEVSGAAVISAAFSGSGTELDPYHWFALGKFASTGRKVTFDFAKCPKLEIDVSGYNEIFYGNDVHVKNANLVVTGSASGSHVTVFGAADGTGEISADGCSFNVDATGNVTGATNGDFVACKWSLLSSGGDCIVLLGRTGGIIRARSVNALAYATSGYESAVIYIGAGDPDGVVFADQIVAPTVSKTGFIQTNLVNAVTGHAVVNSAVSYLAVTGSGAVVRDKV